jgi:hypothetical protein
LAMFSEMIRMRPIWARNPVAATASDFMKSMIQVSITAITSALLIRSFPRKRESRNWVPAFAGTSGV